MAADFPYHEILHEILIERKNAKYGIIVHEKARKVAQLLLCQHLRMFFSKLELVNQHEFNEDKRRLEPESENLQGTQTISTPIKTNEKSLDSLASKSLSPIADRSKSEHSKPSEQFDTAFVRENAPLVASTSDNLETKEITRESFCKKLEFEKDAEESSILRRSESEKSKSAQTEFDRTYVIMDKSDNTTNELAFTRGSYIPDIHLDDYAIIEIGLENPVQNSANDMAKYPKTRPILRFSEQPYCSILIVLLLLIVIFAFVFDAGVRLAYFLVQED